MISAGIIGAMEEEIELIKQKSMVCETISIAGRDFYRCVYKNVEFAAVVSGIGKVNAAICSQILIDRFQPECMINTGVAGAADDTLEIGDIVISRDLVEYDMDTSAFGDPVGQVPRMDVYSFKADDKLISAAAKCGSQYAGGRKIVVGRIVSGDRFVSDEETIRYIRGNFDACAVEMEGAAIGHDCYLNSVPFVVIRSISDRADKKANADFSKFVHESSNISSNMALCMICNLK